MLKILVAVLWLTIGAGVGAVTAYAFPDAPERLLGSSWNAIGPVHEVTEPKYAGEVERTRQEGMFMLARAAVQAQLNDPYSARFEGLTLRKDDVDSIVCGRVNAKNAFGAYVGAVPFSYQQITDRAAIAHRDDTQYGKVMRSMVSEHCPG